jgi:ketosteroid isomerase-like protein
MTISSAPLSYDALCDLAIDWCQAWSFGDLERIMSHYADDAVLNSPKAVEHLGIADGWVRGKPAIREYFAAGLKSPGAPGIRLEFVDLLAGAGHMTVLYRRETGALACDTVEIDGQGRARRVIACYSRPAK